MLLIFFVFFKGSFIRDVYCLETKVYEGLQDDSNYL